MDLKEYVALPKERLDEIILKGKKEKNILILAHNYTRPEILEIADFIGDSLDLSRKAKEAEEKIILFAGVLFMAETAKILNPEKKILVPDLQATCPLASSAAYSDVADIKKQYPDAHFVSYVNSSAETKSIVDICCTSSNAVDVVNSLPDGKIVFLPDKNLGSYAKEKTKRDIILWDGFCYVHEMITPEYILAARKKHPDAVIIIHPECPPESVKLADIVGSTALMYRYAHEHPDKKIILATEIGLIERLKMEIPGSTILPAKSTAVCSNMKINTLAKVARSINELIFEVEIPDNILNAARQSIEKMIQIG